MINANYVIKAIVDSGDGTSKYSMERMSPGKVELFVIRCGTIANVEVGDRVAVDMTVSIAIPVRPVVEVSEIGNTK